MSKSTRRKADLDLWPALSDFTGLARTILGNRHQGPLHRLGLNPEDMQNFHILPNMRRARDYHFYSLSGKRYLDLYRGDGTQLLGYSVPGFNEAVKNRLSQGCYHGVPHTAHVQLKKAVERIFPNHVTVVCPDRYRIQSVLDFFEVDHSRPMLPNRSDLLGASREDSFTFWLPFSVSPGDLCLALLPSLSFQGPFVLLIKKKVYDKRIKSFGSDGAYVEGFLDYMTKQAGPWSISPILKSLAVLETLGAFAGYSISLAGKGAEYPSVYKSLQQRLGVWRESSWTELKISPPWQRIGPYLVHDMLPSEYSKVFREALEKGVLLNPRSAGINTIPGIMTEGEKKLLEDILGKAAYD